MLRLMLFRHAHASHPDGVIDHERPLSSKGVKQARQMGAYIAKERLVPDRVIVSTSLRTQQTWNEACIAGDFQVDKVDEAKVYEAGAGDLLEVVRAQPSDYQTIALVGHNPGTERLAAWLIGDGDPAALARLQGEFVVAGLAVIEFDATSWVEIDVQSGRLSRFATPAVV